MRPGAAHLRRDVSGVGIVLLLGLVMVAGCGDPDAPSVPVAEVSFYTRNQTDAEVSFIVLPAADPAQAFEVSPVTPDRPTGLAGGCLRVPVGSILWMTDGPAKPDGSNTVREILRVEQADAGRAKAVWVDVVGPGLLATTGGGIPPWWTEDQQGC
jgi:hypothetical protein